MTATFDPNIPANPASPADPCIEGLITKVLVTEAPAIGTTNLVVNPDEPFNIEVDWRVFGNLVPIWLTALSVSSPYWIVTAYAEPEGPGDKKRLGTDDVRVDSQPLSLNMSYKATITVPAGTLREENPGNPAYTGVYRLVVTVFLNSALGLPGYDVVGFADGPVIKVENPA